MGQENPVANGILDETVDRYLDGLSQLDHDHPVLDEMEQHALRIEFPIVGRTVGRLLEQQARAVGARRVFEIGSGFGYSAYWFARAVGEDGEIHCTDQDPENAEKAEELLTHAAAWDRVTFHVGEGSEVLAEVDGDFDVILCDADKPRYPEHWRNAAERIRVGGLYLADNVLWYGRAATGEPTPDHPGWTEGIREHNHAVFEDPRYVSTIVPVRDGVLIALRVG
ncbi:MAG: O-methyltransferase [Actinobacteria bacterium]|nr:O-methyltransferase [Actinomycetota bacterium]